MAHRHAGGRTAPASLAIAGFTLIEVLVALAVATLLAAFATPSWRAQNARAELRDRAQSLVQTINVARSEAIKRNARVDVCPSTDRVSCDQASGWEAGWIMRVVDPGADASASSPVLRQEGPARSGITIRGNRPVADYLSFTSLGHARRHDGALQMGSFTVCSSGQRALKVVLANSGRARVDIGDEACS